MLALGGKLGKKNAAGDATAGLSAWFELEADRHSGGVRQQLDVLDVVNDDEVEHEEGKIGLASAWVSTGVSQHCTMIAGIWNDGGGEAGS